jgi:hypothetical protein
MPNETDCLLSEYRTDVELYIHTNQVRQSRINWNFLVQGALLAAVLGSERLPVQILAATLGVVTSVAAYFIVGRHTAYMRPRAVQAREVEAALGEIGAPGPRTFADEFRLFAPRRRNRLLRLAGLPLPSEAKETTFERSGETLRLPFSSLLSANEVEALIVGGVIPLAWVAVLVLSATERL